MNQARRRTLPVYSYLTWSAVSGTQKERAPSCSNIARLAWSSVTPLIRTPCAM